MNEFNYTHIHLFDKSGSELPLILDPAMIIQIPNTYNDDAIFYAISNVDNKICEFYKKSAGGRFLKSDFLSFDDSGTEIIATIGCYIIIEGKKNSGKVKVSLTKVKSNLSAETGVSEYIISDIIDKPYEFLNDYLDIVGFPFVTFKSSLAIDSVSVDLIETQSLYILIEENNEFIKVCESAKTEISGIEGWADRFKLLFFIDNRQQSNFRFFKVENDEAIWTDRILCDLSDANAQTGYRVDIGFTGSEEGVYEQPMIVCLLDSSCNDDEKPGIIYPIGSINLTCEAIGEDERYRALFANFGIPDPINYQNTFQDTDLNEAKTDYKLLNEHSKYIFLTYKDTFPKAGSYGALAKAVSLLGYEDLLYKEWYKETGKDTNNEYITTEVDPENPGGNLDDNTISNQPIEDRISLKKLNWLSLIYKLNEFINPTVEDKYGFYKIRTIHKNYNTDIIIKLIYLKKWLEKHIIGLHCKIVDVGGEGIYLERYRVAPYGSYQQVLEWNNSKNLAPFVVSNIFDESTRLLDSSAYIYTNVGSSDSSTSIEEIKNYRFGDFAKGYLDENDVFHNMPRHAVDDENIIYYGSTLSSFDSFEKYEIRAESKCKSFMFNYDFLTEESARLRVYDDELQFNPIDLLTKKKQSVFNRLPIIQLEKANIRKMNSTWKSSTLYKIYPDYEDDTLSSYFVKNARNGKKVSTVDYVTLVPPEYREDDEYSYITPFGKEEYKIAKSYIPEVTSDNDQGSPYKLYARESDTHGLRYTALNAYEIPLLCMIGYVCPELNGFIYSDEEYCLEILDGKLIFEDPDNSRTIYLNFNYDTESRHQSIELNIVYYSEEFSIVKYRKSFEHTTESVTDIETGETIEVDNEDNNFFYKFFVGNDYSDFVKIYNANPDESSYHDYVHSLKVYNSGEFTVSVFGRDIYNNLFGSVCKNTAYIGMPEVFITGYSNYNTEQVKHCELIDMQKLHNSYKNFCIFKPDYLIHDLKKTLIRKDDNTAIVKFTYPSYSYSSHNVNEGDFLHFMNLSDRYLINAIDIKEYLVHNDEDFAEYNILLQKYTPAPKQRVLENDDYQALTQLNNNAVLTYTGDIKPITSTNFIKGIKDNEYYNFSDVNFILYNELANTVIIQTPGNMINDKAIPYVDASLSEYASLKYTNFYRDQYRLFLGDDSFKSYIWAILETTSEESIPKYLSNYSYEAIDDNIALPYENVILIDSHEIDSSDNYNVTFELEETNLYNVSKFLINLFKDHNDFTIPTSDASINGWSMENHFNYLFDSLQKIKSIDILKHAQSIEDIIERNELYGEKFIRDGIELLLDGPTKEESSMWFNLYFEIKSNLIKTNYDIFKDIAAKQIYNIFARQTIYADISEEERFAKKLKYRLINTDAAAAFEANDALGHFLDYIISYDEIEDESDPGSYLYANIFLMADAIRAMQVFSIDEYLLIDTINGVIDALNTYEYNDKEDYLNICKSIYHNIYKNFMRSESDIFGVVNSVLVANNSQDASSYNMYEAVLNSVAYDSSLNLPESFNIEIGNFSSDLYYRNIESLDTVEEGREINGYNWQDDDPPAAKLQNIIYEFYDMFLKDNDEVLSDPEKYGTYYICIVYAIYCYFGLVIADYIYNNGVYKLDPDSGELVDNIHTDDIVYKSNDIDNIFIQYVSSDIYVAQNESYKLTRAFADGLFNYIFGIYEETAAPVNENSEEEPDPIITIKDTLISGLLKEESVSDTSDEYEPLYTKLLNNLIHYDINYLKSINWVTTTAYIDDITDRYYGKIVNLYAVAAGDPLETLLTNLYYVKLPDYEREGYIFINRMESTASSIGNLENIIETPYITSYIQPTWKAQVIIIILSNKNAASMGFDIDEDADPEGYSNYMAIEYFNKKFTHAFNTGEMIKLVFESVENNEYIGQSSYEVVGYDISKKFVIVKGSINPAYIRKTGYEVWAKVKDCEFENTENPDESYVDLEKNLMNEFSTYVADINKLVYKQIQEDYDGVKTTFAGINSREILKTYMYEKVEVDYIYNDDSSVAEKIETITTTAVPYSLPVKYWWDDDDIDYYHKYEAYASDPDADPENPVEPKYPDSANMTDGNPGNYGSWYYQVMIYQNGTMYPIESSYTIADEMVNVYISYAHNAYADYVLKATDFVEKPDGYSEVYVDYKGIDIRKCDFIDDTFALSIRDYDTNIGMAAWMNRTPLGNKEYTPNILTTVLINEDNDKINTNWIELTDEFPLYKLDMRYVSKEPKQIVLNKDNTNVAFDVNFETTEIDKDTATVFWRIYKENLDGSKKRLFDSYNTTLFLDIDEPGNYDIEAFVSDTYGNVASTYYNAAIKII